MDTSLSRQTHDLPRVAESLCGCFIGALTKYWYYLRIERQKTRIDSPCFRVYSQAFRDDRLRTIAAQR